MFRSFFIYLSKVSWAQRIVLQSAAGKKISHRFVAGETPEAAIRVVRELNAQGVLGTLDHLGENTVARSDAGKAAEDILLILDLIEQAGVNSTVSVKLTQIGLLLDETLSLEHLRRILDKARLQHNFIRLDMEDSTLAEKTLNVYHKMRLEGFDNLGVVIQSYLFRSEADLCELVKVNASVRLVKGAYKEPPQVAFPKKSDVDANYDRLTDILLEGAAHDLNSSGAAPLPNGSNLPPMAAIATHDVRRQEHAIQAAEKFGLPKSAVEFQMLYGIRRDLQAKLVAAGYPVRVYIPYGTQWYPYLMRRMGERPANLFFMLPNFFRK